MRKSNDATPAPAFRILLIDDNRNGLLVRKSVLTEQGYSVTACGTPEDALVRFTEDRFDLVVTDYRMPRINGTELISRFREITPEMPMVLVSSVVDVIGLNEQNTGADAVVAKNSTEVQHMLLAVGRLLTRKTPKKPARGQASRSRARRVDSA